MKSSRKTGKPCVLVIGAGIAGVTAAESLAKAGAEVHVVEKQPDIGGHVRAMGCKAADICLRCNVCVADQRIRSFKKQPRIRLHTSTELTSLLPGAKRRFIASLARNRGSRKTRIDVDAVVVATGHSPFNPVENASFGYGRIANVMTGEEAERQLAEKSRITRPSDGAPARRIAFIQCVGSRTEEVFRRPEDTNYCSTVCCSYALRMARQIKHRAADSEITVFHMDIQNFGKGFNEFYKTAQDKMRFIRSRPFEMLAGENGAVKVKYTPDGATDKGAVLTEDFDLVILSVGIRPQAGAAALAETLGIPTDLNGFFGIKGASALPDLQKEGLYVAGTSESPKDIAATIAQAEAVSVTLMNRMSRQEF